MFNNRQIGLKIFLFYYVLEKNPNIKFHQKEFHFIT